MASRTSAMRSQELYLGSKRGRLMAENMDWGMFPEKNKINFMYEDNPTDDLENDWRATLKDLSPESNSLFPHELARRNTYARDRLNLREGGARVTTDPWANEGFDTQFHDHDPRGWSTEQPWSEYRRLLEKQYQNIDFKDDGDNSVPSSMLHPNTMYKKIRGAQNWVKSRLKIFSEEWEGKQNGGVGIYPNVSKVYRSDFEDSSAQTDGTAPSRTFDDPEVAQHHNINISNLVHLGSKMLRENSTTDHLVKVAAYGKLYKQRGLINHESQLRILEDDTPWSNLSSTQSPRNLVKMMSSQIYSDNANISPYTASEIGRILMQSDQVEQGSNQGISRDEVQLQNRNQILTKDIMALLGITDNDIKFLESYKGSNKKMMKHALTDIYNMGVLVHQLPANEKLQIRNELILRSAGMGLTPSSDSRKIQDRVIINPKIIEFMAHQAGKTPNSNFDLRSNLDFADADPENKLNNPISNTSIFIYKSPNNTEDLNSIMWESQNSEHFKDTSKKTANYKNVNKYSQKLERNRMSTNPTQDMSTSNNTPLFTAKSLSDSNYQENLRNAEIDNHFGDNKYLTRHMGVVGTKQMRRHMNTDTLIDQMSELGITDIGKIRKNPKNMNNQSK